MRKTIIFSILFIPIYSLAQKSYLDGYVVTTANDTLFGKVKDRKSVPIAELYTKIRFIDEKGKKIKLPIRKVSSYKAGENYFESMWVDETMQNFVTQYYVEEGRGEKRFMKVIQKGKLSYYQYEFMDDDSSFMYSADFFKRPGDNYMVRATQGVLGLKRKRLETYFQDCPELGLEITNKKLNTIQEILDFYTAGCP